MEFGVWESENQYLKKEKSRERHNCHLVIIKDTFLGKNCISLPYFRDIKLHISLEIAQ